MIKSLLSSASQKKIRYIAIDGTSLTVCEVNREVRFRALVVLSDLRILTLTCLAYTQEGWFTFMLIAYTQKHIIIPKKQVGDKVRVRPCERGSTGCVVLGAEKGGIQGPRRDPIHPFITFLDSHDKQVNLEVDVLAKYVERSVGPIIDQLRGEIGALQARVAQLEGGR